MRINVQNLPIQLVKSENKTHYTEEEENILRRKRKRRRGEKSSLNNNSTRYRAICK